MPPQHVNTPAPIQSEATKPVPFWKRKIVWISALLITLVAEPFVWVLFDNTFGDILSGHYTCNFFDSSSSCGLFELITNSLGISVMFNLFTVGLYTIIPALAVFVALTVLLAIGAKILNITGSRRAGHVFVVGCVLILFSLVMIGLSTALTKERAKLAAYHEAQANMPSATVDRSSNATSSNHRIYGTASNVDSVIIVLRPWPNTAGSNDVDWQSEKVPVVNGKWFVDVTIPQGLISGDYRALQIRVHSGKQADYNMNNMEPPLIIQNLIYVGPR